MKWALRFSIFYLCILTVISLIVTHTSLFEKSWEPNVEQMLQSPSAHHWMGTDALGRDLMFRIFSGAQLSLSVGVMGALISLALGTTIGITLGYRGGWLDLICMRLIEVFNSLPQMVTSGVLIFILSAWFPEARSSALVFALALGMSSWMSFARLSRNLVLRERALPYIEAARVLGASRTHIFTQHLLRNIFPTLLVTLGLQIPGFLLFESFLSFVGLGIQPPQVSWGVLMQEGWRNLATQPYLVLWPAGFLYLTSFSLNLVFENLSTQREQS